MVTMLAACDLNKSKAGSIKEPKFAKANEEIEFAAFAEDMSSDEVFGDFASGDVTKLPSFTFKSYSANSQTRKVTRNKKVLRESIMNEENSYFAETDTKNNRVHTEGESTYYASYKVETGKEVEKYTDKGSQNIQLNKFENNREYVVVIDNDAKQFNRTTDTTDMIDSEKKAQLFDGAYMMVWNGILQETFWDTYYDYENLTDEIKNCYKFYRDSKVYTVEYVYEEEYGVKDNDDNLLYTQKDRYEFKFQFDTSKRLDSALSYKEINSTSHTLTFNKNMEYSSDMYLEGDVYEDIYKVVFDNSVEKDEKLEVKEVDLSKLYDMDVNNNTLLP